MPITNIELGLDHQDSPSHVWYKISWDDTFNIAAVVNEYRAHLAEFFHQEGVFDFVSGLRNIDVCALRFSRIYRDWLIQHVGPDHDNWFYRASISKNGARFSLSLSEEHLRDQFQSHLETLAQSQTEWAEVAWEEHADGYAAEREFLEHVEPFFTANALDVPHQLMSQRDALLVTLMRRHRQWLLEFAGRQDINWRADVETNGIHVRYAVHFRDPKVAVMFKLGLG